jgi:hypothetical protein
MSHPVNPQYPTKQVKIAHHKLVSQLPSEGILIDHRPRQAPVSALRRDAELLINPYFSNSKLRFAFAQTAGTIWVVGLIIALECIRR